MRVRRVWARVWRRLAVGAIVGLTLWTARKAGFFAAGNNVILATAQECRILASKQLLTWQAAADVRAISRRCQLLAGRFFAVEFGLEVTIWVHPKFDLLVAGLEVGAWIHLHDLLAALGHMNEDCLGLCIAGAEVEGQG